MMGGYTACVTAESATHREADVFNVSYVDLRDAKVARSIWMYGSLLLLVVGTLGNLLSVCVMLRPRLRDSATALYLIVLAFSDTVVLFTSLLRYWILATFDLDVRDLSRESCRVHVFLVYVSRSLSSWILVCVTLERFVTVFFPFKAKVMFTRSLAALSAAIVLIILVLLHAHFLWTRNINEETGKCTVDAEYDDFDHNVRHWIDLVLSSLLPFCIMLTCNIAMLSRVYRVANCGMKVDQNSAISRRPRTSSMTATLVVVTSVFILTTLPLSVHIIIVNVHHAKATDLLLIAQLNLRFSALSMISNVNHSVNFLLYCVSGRKFRQEFVNLLHRRRARVTPYGAAALPVQENLGNETVA